MEFGGTVDKYINAFWVQGVKEAREGDLMTGGLREGWAGEGEG